MASQRSYDIPLGRCSRPTGIGHPGSSISGGPPAESALGYTQWQALRRLYERGAAMNLSRAAALGLMPLVTELAAATPPPDGEELATAFWNACRAGQLEAARYLAGRGADINWRAPGPARPRSTRPATSTSARSSPG